MWDVKSLEELGTRLCIRSIFWPGRAGLGGRKYSFKNFEASHNGTKHRASSYPQSASLQD